MTTTLEKAARAAWSSYPNDDASFDGLTADQKDTAYKQARAVLLAIREPDDEQVRAGWMAVPGYDYDRDDIKMAFEIMIDAILAQPSGGEG